MGVRAWLCPLMLPGSIQGAAREMTVCKHGEAPASPTAVKNKPNYFGHGLHQPKGPSLLCPGLSLQPLPQPLPDTVS